MRPALCRHFLAVGGRLGAGFYGAACPCKASVISIRMLATCSTSVEWQPGSSHGGGPATSPKVNWATWLLAVAAAAPGACSADAPARQSAAAARGPPSLTATASEAGSAHGGGAPGAALTNHPLEYDPVTNEHTAKMTLARTAALEFYNAGKYAQAEAKFREAVAEAKLGFEPHDPHIASAKNNLAEFLRNTGRWDEAEVLYKEALDLLERNFGERHWLFVAALHNLALSYEARGDLAAARTAMERVLGLRLAMFGPQHFLYADSLFALGHMLRADNGPPGQVQRAEGLRMMEEAVRRLEEAEKLQVNVALYWLTEIAGCHTADGRPALAATALRRALTHLAAERGGEAADASALNEQLVEALAAAGRPLEAAAAAETALAARRKLFGEGALAVAQSEMRVAQLQLVAANHTRSSAPPPSSPGPGPALRALQHAEAAARISAANVEECSRGGLLTAPPPDRLIKRLRSAHTLGSAAKLVATLSGVADPAAVSAAAAAAAADDSPAAGAPAPAPPAPATKRWSWWPFGSKAGAGSSAPPAADAAEPHPAPRAAPQVLLPPQEPVAELALADRRLEQAAAALTGAVQAGQQLLQAVGSGQRQLPAGMSPDEVAGLLVEAQLQLLDVLERLGQVLQARVASGQGTGPDVVERHRRILEQQERVAVELLA